MELGSEGAYHLDVENDGRVDFHEVALPSSKSKVTKS